MKTELYCPECGRELKHWPTSARVWCARCGAEYSDMQVAVDPSFFKRPVHQPWCPIDHNHGVMSHGPGDAWTCLACDNWWGADVILNHPEKFRGNFESTPKIREAIRFAVANFKEALVDKSGKTDPNTATGKELDEYASRVGLHRLQLQTASAFQDVAVETDDSIRKRLKDMHPSSTWNLMDIKKYLTNNYNVLDFRVFESEDVVSIVLLNRCMLRSDSVAIYHDIEKGLPVGIKLEMTTAYTDAEFSAEIRHKAQKDKAHTIGLVPQDGEPTFTELVSKTDKMFIIHEAFLDCAGFIGLQKPTTTDGKLALIKKAHAFVCSAEPDTRIDELPWKFEWENDLWYLNYNGKIKGITEMWDKPVEIPAGTKCNEESEPPNEHCPRCNKVICPASSTPKDAECPFCWWPIWRPEIPQAHVEPIQATSVERNADGTKSVYNRPKVPYTYVPYVPWDPEDNDDLLG